MSAIRALPIIAALTATSCMGVSGRELPYTAKHAAASNPASTEASLAADAPDSTTLPCKPGEDNRLSDLCAQWKAADAAVRGAYWTGWGVAVAIVAAALSALTMLAALAAAIYARRAAVETKKSADAAAGANIIARQAMITEQRPWLQIEAKLNRITLVNRIVNISALVTITNTGNTPAVRVGSYFKFKNDHVKPKNGRWYQRRTIFPNSKENIIFTLHSLADEGFDPDDEHPLIFQLGVKYETIFEDDENEHETTVILAAVDHHFPVAWNGYGDWKNIELTIAHDTDATLT